MLGITSLNSKKINIEMEDLEIQRWMSESIIFLGFLFLMFRFLQLMIKILKGEAEGFSHIDEAKESIDLAAQIKKEEQAAGGSK